MMISRWAKVNAILLLMRFDGLGSGAALQRLERSFLQHASDFGGRFELIRTGIVQGSPLSPLLGGVYLRSLDTELQQEAKVRGGRYAAIYG